MKKFAIVVLAFLLCFAGSEVWAEDSGIRFSDLAGEVQVCPKVDLDDEAWEMAGLDDVLNVDDHIKTGGNDSSAILSLTDMTTFVMKPRTEIILSTPPEKENKITLITGKVWVNVKKMIKDGSMEVDMSQAIAGIKGTNITCSQSEDKTENRVKVLRGVADVLIRETREIIQVNMGEELVIKPGGKTEKQEIDVQAEQKLWEDATSKLGESIQMNEVPENLQKIIELESTEFARLKDDFQKLIELQAVEEDIAWELQKDADRFLGALLEDTMIIASMKKKVADALTTPNLSEADRQKIAGYSKLINETISKRAGFEAETNKIMSFKFKLSSLDEDALNDIAAIENELNSIVAEIDGIKNGVLANPNGKSQEEFSEAYEKGTELVETLNELVSKTESIIEVNPDDPNARNLLKRLNDQITVLSSVLKQVEVVEVDSSKLVEMQEFDDKLSDNIVLLNNEILAYNSLSGTTDDVKQKRLRSSLLIMRSFVTVKRQYESAQRLYDQTMRASQSTSFKTSEQEEIENSWTNISNKFQELGVVAEQLQNNIADLENQLSTFLK